MYERLVLLQASIKDNEAEKKQGQRQIQAAMDAQPNPQFKQMLSQCNIQALQLQEMEFHMVMRDAIIAAERQKVEELWTVLGQLATESEIRRIAEEQGIQMESPEINGVAFLEHSQSMAAAATASAAAVAAGVTDHSPPRRPDWLTGESSRRATQNESAQSRGGGDSERQGAGQGRGSNSGAGSVPVRETGTSWHPSSTWRQQQTRQPEGVASADPSQAKSHTQRQLAAKAQGTQQASLPPDELTRSYLPSAFQEAVLAAGAPGKSPSLARLAQRSSARTGRDRSASLLASHDGSGAASARQARAVGRNDRRRGPLSSLPEGEVPDFGAAAARDGGAQRAARRPRRAAASELVAREHSSPATLEVRSPRLLKMGRLVRQNSVPWLHVQHALERPWSHECCTQALRESLV